ncbi:unnamed protein product [Cuscuta campestris]|uniref:Protein TIC 22-like, chloroplastic n=1 Tax=Cuscuta campestris TaxID=132261 RepID=A0A484NJ82_9ASTE|nr:unnamed protein product [Cuscuta campestris]
MNFFQQKPPPPLNNSSSPPPPLHEFVQQAFTSLQTNVSNFFQNALQQPPFHPRESPALARASSLVSSPNGGASISSGGGGSREGIRSSPTTSIRERFTGVPLYALSNPNQEFVLVSAGNGKTSLGLFCLGEADAASILHQLKSIDPSMHKDYRVVPVALNEVISSFNLKCTPYECQFLLPLMLMQVRKRSGISDTTFPGVPVFQSNSLVLRKENTRYRPFFFRKEDLEKSLSRASRDQNILNPALKGDIQVDVLEDIIQGMKDSSTSAWNNVVFIPPGFDVSTNPPRR